MLTARTSDRYVTVGDLNRTATPRQSYRKRSDEKTEKGTGKTKRPADSPVSAQMIVLTVRVANVNKSEINSVKKM
jgi:hypothetical protein